MTRSSGGDGTFDGGSGLEGGLMTPIELLALIDSDAEATTLANAGNDTQCAVRCSAIAPKRIVPTRLGDINIVGLFDNPADGETVCQTIEAVAEVNPVVRRAWRWAGPTAPGIDVGDAKVRLLLVAPTNLGGIGLTQQQAAPLLAAAEQPQTITAQDVGYAMAARRTAGE